MPLLPPVDVFSKPRSARVSLKVKAQTMNAQTAAGTSQSAEMYEP
jgi:hypothetical protein